MNNIPKIKVKAIERMDSETYTLIGAGVIIIIIIVTSFLMVKL